VYLSHCVRHRRPRLLALPLAALLAVGSLPLAGPTLAAGDTFRIESPSIAATVGASVSVRVVGNTDVETAGAQASVTFDASRLQVTSIAKGSDWVAAGAGYAGYPGTANMAAFIATANAAGRLPAIAAFFTADSLPAGDHDLLAVTFTVIACGDAAIDLAVGPADAGMLDGRPATYGDPLAVTTTGGTVSAPCGPGVPTPAPSPARTGPGAGSVPQPASPAPSGSPSRPPFPSPSRPSGSVTGIVALDGAAVANAEVVLYAWPNVATLHGVRAGTRVDPVWAASGRTDASGRFGLTPAAMPAHCVEADGTVNFVAVVSSGSSTIHWDFGLNVSQPADAAAVDVSATTGGARRTIDLRIDVGKDSGVDDTGNPAMSWRGQVPSELTHAGLMRVPLTTSASVAGPAPDLYGCTWVATDNYQRDVPEMFANVWAWQQAKVDMYENVASAHTVGVAFLSAAGSWSQSGTVTWTEHHGGGGTASGLWDNYVGNKVNYREWAFYCGWFTGDQEWRPDLMTSPLDPILGWPHDSHPDWSGHYGCSEVAVGSRFKSGGANTTQAIGVGFPFISLSAQAGWISDVMETWTFTNGQPSWLCGSTNDGWLSAPEAEAQAAPPVYDINMDGVVGLADLGQVTGHWGSLGESGWVRADVNHDGGVGLADIGRITGHWGQAGYHPPT
jgi:hypothetical protein